ncbi:DMT family transporter [bacterium]|nr:MAG: DMT family transporter [bacterium]
MWFVLTLLNALFDSVQKALQKKAVMNSSIDEKAAKYVAACAPNLYSLVILVPMVVRDGIPVLDRTFWWIMAAVTILAATGSVIYMWILQRYDMSLIVPVVALFPLALIFTSKQFYKEPLTPMQIAGVVLGVAGVYLLQLDKAKAGLLKPLVSLFTDKGCRLALLIVAIYATGASLDKAAVRHSSPMFYAFAMHFFSLLFLLPFTWYKTKSLMPVVLCGKWLMAAGLCSGLSQICQYYAISLTTIAHLFSVKRSGVLFSVLWGWLFFKEGQIKERFLGAAVMVCGTVILYVFS